MTELLIKLFIKKPSDTQNPIIRSAYGSLAGTIGILCNIFLFITKLVAGIISGSISITADAVNNLSDASSNIISLLGFKMGSKPADTEHPYGHARYEYLSGLTVAIIILVIGIELLQSSIMKVFHPEAVAFSPTLVIILCISILIKLWMMIFNRKIGSIISSKTLEATAADSRNDVISTSSVLVATLISHYTGIELDAYMGIAVGLFILYSGFNIIKETLDPLLGKAPDPEFVDYIQHKILGYEGILGTHDLMVHDYGPGRQFASVHVEIDAECDVISSHDLIDTIEHDFLKNDNLHIVIHHDPIVTNDSALSELRRFISESVKTIHKDMAIHDLSLSVTPTHTHVIFDCLVPTDCTTIQSDLYEQISNLVHEKYPDYICIITFDSSYAPIQR